MEFLHLITLRAKDHQPKNPTPNMKNSLLSCWTACPIFPKHFRLLLLPLISPNRWTVIPYC